MKSRGYAWLHSRERLACLLDIPRHELVVIRLDVKSLPFAYAIPQFVSLGNVFVGDTDLAEIGVGHTESQIGAGKIGIKFNGALVVGDLRCQNSQLSESSIPANTLSAPPAKMS